MHKISPYCATSAVFYRLNFLYSYYISTPKIPIFFLYFDPKFPIFPIIFSRNSLGALPVAYKFLFYRLLYWTECLSDSLSSSIPRHADTESNVLWLSAALPVSIFSLFQCPVLMANGGITIHFYLFPSANFYSVFNIISFCGWLV